MQWKIDFGDRPWHPWFAWYPVEFCYPYNGRRAWLEYVERQTTNCQGYIIHHYKPKGSK